MAIAQSLTRGAIRRDIGKNIGLVVDGVVTANGDTLSLIDTTRLDGGTNEYNRRKVIIYDATGSIVDGESSRVSAFTAYPTSDATLSTAFTAATAVGDKYEMWKRNAESDWDDIVNSAINQAIDKVTGQALVTKEAHTPWTEDSKYQYDVLSGFSHLYKVEYAYNVDTKKTIHTCDAVWNESVDGDVTASVDTDFNKEGSGSLKLVVAAGAAAADILATEDITSLDLSGCTEIAIWIWSSVALSAGDIQVLLDNTASCASPVESLNVPATTANTWTRHIISLANPYNDSAIISVGLKMVVDKGAFTLRADDIYAQDANSIQYYEIPDEYWSIAKGSTAYLQLTPKGLEVIGDNKQLRLSGFRIPARMTADTDTSDVDPGWLIPYVTGRLLASHAFDIKDRQSFADYWANEAARKESGIVPTMPGSTKVVS